MKKLILLFILLTSTRCFAQDIFDAINGKKYDELTILAKSEANKRGRNKMTPLLTAVGINDLKSVKILVENGADVSLTPNSGWTPLMVACQSADEEMCLFASSRSRR